MLKMRWLPVQWLSCWDLPHEGIRKAMENFSGIQRRFEYHIRTEKLAYIDDYAHHPQEIEATIRSLRNLYPDKKLTGIFQPHLYTRTRDLADEFAASLSLLDSLILLEIYPARELPIEGVTAGLILDKVKLADKQICDRDNLLELLKKTNLEILITLGAGDIDKMVEPIKELIDTATGFMKRIKNILFIAGITTYLVIVIGFISDKEQLQHVSAVKIRIADSTQNEFIHVAEIRRYLDRQKFQLSGVNSNAIDLEGIEKSLMSRQIISKAEAYITEPGILHLDVRQKSPFVRVYNRMGQGYYLDEKGNIIPLSPNFSPYVLVVNGNISEPFSVNKTLNIFNVKHDSLPASQKTIYDVYRLVTFIHGDKFWNSQIEQVYVNGRYEFELIPRVGSQVIELGSADNLQEKFDNLELLYQKGFNKIGWNQYQRISLKYKNQVVCTKNQ